MSNDVEAKRRELESLRARIRELEADLGSSSAAEAESEAAEYTPWRPTGYYAAYYATSGFMLGIFGAITSLLVSVISSLGVGKSALELIRIYLTFPLGEEALQLTGATQVYAVPNNLILTFGCCLYLGTGMFLGIPVYLAITRFAERGPTIKRLAVGAAAALAVWAALFYGVLSWLQPLLFGGNWITNPEYLPWWVAAANHLVFGLTIGLLSNWGLFEPYSPPTAEGAGSSAAANPPATPVAAA